MPDIQQKVQTRIFSQAFNPTGIRAGNSVLRQRLRGPSVAAYYPRRMPTVADLNKAYKHWGEDFETWDDDEEDRLDSLTLRKLRGKGAPKKRRTLADSKGSKGASAGPKKKK